MKYIIKYKHINIVRERYFIFDMSLEIICFYKQIMQKKSYKNNSFSHSNFQQICLFLPKKK